MSLKYTEKFRRAGGRVEWMQRFPLLQIDITDTALYEASHQLRFASRSGRTSLLSHSRLWPRRSRILKSRLRPCVFWE